MMKPRHTRHCASAAIAAALALSTAPLLAQDAEIPSPVAPQPEFVTPEAPPPAPVEPTVAAPAPAPEAAPPPTTARTTTTTTTTRTERAPATAPRPAARIRPAAPAEPAPQAVAEDSVPTEVEPAAEPIAPLAVEQPVAEPTTAATDNSLLVGASVVGGAAALILAIWGFIAIGRRRPIANRAVPVVERPVVNRAEPAPPLAEPSLVASQAAWTPAPAANMAHSGAAVPLPRTMPATFEERDALIKRMIAARPDRANPFTAPLQRRKRAKLILQSLGRNFGDQEPWIDLSQYPQNWPELAQNRYAAA